MKYKCGDILGFSGHGVVGDVINLATYGIPRRGLSHVGILNEHKENLYLFETDVFSDIPCAITGNKVNGTQARQIDSTIESYEGKIWHYPLYRSLEEYEIRKLHLFLISTLGLDYDYIGAFRAAGVGFSWIESLLYEENLDSIFCSEWVAASYKVIGLLPTDNASKWSPNKLTRHLRRQGTLLEPIRIK